MKNIPMTLLGIKKLQEELHYLKKIRRPKIIQDIIEARKHGDLKENAEYAAAREQQSFCEGRIKEIESKLLHAQIIDVTKMLPSNKVIFGATVKMKNLYTNKKQTYQIVGDDEADFKKNLISINSPIARGIISKEEGNTVVIQTPSGNISYQILKVQYI